MRPFVVSIVAQKIGVVKDRRIPKLGSPFSNRWSRRGYLVGPGRTPLFPAELDAAMMSVVDEKTVRTASKDLVRLVGSLGWKDLATLEGPFAPTAECAAFYKPIMLNPDKMDEKSSDLCPVIGEAASVPCLSPFDVTNSGKFEYLEEKWIGNCDQRLIGNCGQILWQVGQHIVP